MAKQKAGIRRLVRHYLRVLVHEIRHSQLPHYARVLAVGIAVGAVGGLSAIGFRWLYTFIRGIFFTTIPAQLPAITPWWTIVAPAVGGLLVGPLITWMCGESRGSGIPALMRAIVTAGGKIRARTAPVRMVASSLTAASGGSVGREGPIVHIGAALSSLVAQLLNLRRNEMRVVVAAGAAAGIAATFNSPLAGAFFAHEVVLLSFGADSFFQVVVASVVGSVFGYMAFGTEPAFRIPAYSLQTYQELLAFLILGLVTAVVGVAFTRLLHLSRLSFRRSPIPAWLTPAVGGLAVGFIGFYDPRVLSIGYDVIGNVLHQERVLIGGMLLLAFLKIVATSLSIGSGGSGGLIAPSLFVGAAVGAAFGQFAHGWGAMTSASAYALVGMGGLFSATGHAPITSVLTVFELTRDYSLMLPLMLTCGVSTIAARILFRFSMFNHELVQHGIHYSLIKDTRLLDQVTVEEAMETDVISIRPDATVDEAVNLFEETRHHGFPIAESDGTLHGILALHDIRRAIRNEMHDATVQDIGTHEVIVAFPDESLNDAIRKMGLRDVGRLPVVSRENHTRMLGLVTRGSIIAAYNRALIHRHTRLTDTVQPEHIE